MNFTNLMSVKRKRELPLYFFNAAMAITISSGVFILSLPVGMALTAQCIDSAKLSKLIPKSMQFLEINGLKHMTPQINAIFYIGLIFAVLTTAATICMLCNMHERSQKIAMYKSFHTTKGQTVSYSGEANNVHYVMLNEKYSPGCIMISKSGKRIAILGNPEVVESVEKDVQQEPKKNYMYPVIAYYHKTKLTSQTEADQTKTDQEVIIGLEGFRTDFFKKGATSRDDVTILEHNPRKLIDLFIEPHKKTKAPKAPRSPGV